MINSFFVFSKLVATGVTKQNNILFVSPHSCILKSKYILIGSSDFGALVFLVTQHLVKVQCNTLFFCLQLLLVVFLKSLGFFPLQALGCILYLLCFKQHPFEEGAKLQIVNGKYNIPQNDTKYTVFHQLIRKYPAGA